MNYDNADLFNRIRSCAAEGANDVIELRRHFHQYPELSWKEFKTAEMLDHKLGGLGLEVTKGICGTGITAELSGASSSRTLAIRADMDALPMDDDKDVPYASRVPGVIHACGHDCHMAMAYGVARVLTEMNLDLPGNVRFIFQPCEEAIPSGALELVNAGVMDGVDGILAYHVDPELEAGAIGLRSGVLTAHCSEFRLTIFGKSGHAARPHHAVDTIHLSTRVLKMLYDIVGNRSQPFMPAVLTIGKLAGGRKANVIPDVVEIAGTVRTVDSKSHDEILTAIEENVRAITRAVGGGYELEFPDPVPSVVNDAGMVNMIREVATEMLTSDCLKNIEHVSMGGEDFSWYLSKAPGALIRLGARKPGSEISYLHTNKFDIDESALSVGVALMAMLIIRYLAVPAGGLE